VSLRPILGKRLVATFLFACVLLAAHSAAAFANVASVSIVAPNATQQVATSVTVSGSSQLARNLYVYVDSDAADGCDPNPAFENEFASTVLANGTTVGPGNFSATYSYTPASANATYEICAYVDDTTSGTPDASSHFVLSTIPPAKPPKPRLLPRSQLSVRRHDRIPSPAAITGRLSRVGQSRFPAQARSDRSRSIDRPPRTFAVSGALRTTKQPATSTRGGRSLTMSSLDIHATRRTTTPRAR
jgi:hypothetical protein